MKQSLSVLMRKTCSVAVCGAEFLDPVACMPRTGFRGCTCTLWWQLTNMCPWQSSRVTRSILWYNVCIYIYYDIHDSILWAHTTCWLFSQIKAKFQEGGQGPTNMAVQAHPEMTRWQKWQQSWLIWFSKVHHILWLRCHFFLEINWLNCFSLCYVPCLVRYLLCRKPCAVQPGSRSSYSWFQGCVSTGREVAMAFRQAGALHCKEVN